MKQIETIRNELAKPSSSSGNWTDIDKNRIEKALVSIETMYQETLDRSKFWHDAWFNYVVKHGQESRFRYIHVYLYHYWRIRCSGYLRTLLRRR